MGGTSLGIANRYNLAKENKERIQDNLSLGTPSKHTELSGFTKAYQPKDTHAAKNKKISAANPVTNPVTNTVTNTVTNPVTNPVNNTVDNTLTNIVTNKNKPSSLGITQNNDAPATNGANIVVKKKAPIYKQGNTYSDAVSAPANSKIYNI